MYDYIVYVQRSGDQSEEPTGVPVRAPFGRCIGSSHSSTYIFGAVEYSRSLRQSSSSCVVPQHETRTLLLQYVFCGGLAACSLLANDQRKLVWKCESTRYHDHLLPSPRKTPSLHHFGLADLPSMPYVHSPSPTSPLCPISAVLDHGSFDDHYRKCGAGQRQ